MGWFSKATGGALDFISDPLADASDVVADNWVDLRDTAQAAAVVAGNYYLPGSSIITSKLVTGGAQDKLNTDLGKTANFAAGVSGGFQGNAANYGKIGEAAGLTSGAANTANAARTAADAQFLAADASQLAAQGLSQSAIEQNLVGAGVNSFVAADAAQLALQGIPPEQMSTMLAQSTGAETIFSNPAVTKSLTASQITQLAKAGISLAGLAGAANAVSNTGEGGLMTQQDRSGFSSGSANYSPEYYAAIQNKYNQYMPGAKGADITTDLKNWYETKYTPNAAVAGNSTLNTTGTGYTTPTTMTNLGVKPQTVAPSYSILNPRSSTDVNVGTEYAKYIAANGGNTPENRAAAIKYLQDKGFSGPQIDAAYNQYLGTLPASTGTTAETMAANATPAQIAQAYGAYAAANGGDNQANQAAAIQYLQKIGVPYATIEAAYPIYKSSIAPAQQSTGMLTGAAQAAQTAQTPTTPLARAATNTNTVNPSNPLANAAIASNASQPSYTSLSGSSSPAAIAAAYRDYVASAGGDTTANQQAAQSYLANLGVSPDTVNQAYGLFKG